MNPIAPADIPSYALYGEDRDFPDILHCERIFARAHQHGWQISAHRHHNLFQVFLVNSGHAEMSLDGQHHVLAPPAVVFLPCHHVHGFAFESDTEGFVLSVPAAQVAGLLELYPELSALMRSPFIGAADAALFELLTRIEAEQSGDLPARRPMLLALATEVFSMLARNVAKLAEAQSPARQRVAAFERLVRVHLGAGWGVADFAREIGISPTHLTRLCREVTGLSPSAYQQAQQMQEAQRLLAYTKLSIAQVGYRLGFEDPSYFSRVFRRQMGESPGAFRARFG